MRPFAVDVLPAFGQAVPALSAAFAENPGTNNDVLRAITRNFFMHPSIDIYWAICKFKGGFIDALDILWHEVK